MKKYYFRILKTEDTIELFEGLIGTIATFEGTKGEYITQSLQDKIKLNTLDGELIFKRSEIRFFKEV